MGNICSIVNEIYLYYIRKLLASLYIFHPSTNYIYIRIYNNKLNQ